VTRRSFVVGLIVSVWANLWPAFTSLIVHSSRADHAHLSLALLIPFVFLLGLNHILTRSNRHLSSSELITISSMGIVASCMQGEWLSGWYLGIVTAPTYFATAENRWADLLLQHLPGWGVVDRQATIPFYEGLAEGGSVSWGHWVGPLFWWGSFFGAVLVSNACISVILRRQWMENEKLPFPVATVLLELTGVSGSRGTLQVLLKDRLFWFGFWAVFGMILWNVSTWFVHAVPALPILNGAISVRQIPIAPGFPGFILTDSILTFIFGYFTKSEVLFSLWFFNILTIFQIGFFARLGYSIGGADPWTSSDPAVGWQNFGGMIVFVAWGLWVARDHLKDVFRAAVGKGAIDDSGELLTYRFAFWGLILSNLFLALFLHRAGMGWSPILAFGFATWVLYLGLSRIMVESGLVFLRGPITAQAFTWHVLGAVGMGPASSAMVGLTYAFGCDTKTLAMTAFAHIPRLGAAMNVRSRKKIVGAILLACLLGAITVISFTLYQGHHVTGSYNFGVKSFNGHNDGPVGVWRVTANRIQAATLVTDWTRISLLGVGGSFVGLLYWLRYRFPGFPLHPIGFIFPATIVSRRVVTSVFLVWLVKTVLLRVGGLELYRRTTPLFIGLLIGFLIGIAFHVVVDTIWFYGHGHEIHVSW
jgi:hypothetical protein